ncbi:hypothetical protein KBC86_00555 [Candidatus Gracilibacteria bacterium]|nr:hypothetical protein [Candidatus Gracilibacteria bacterium]
MGKNSTAENFEARMEGSVLPKFQMGNVEPIFRRFEARNVPKKIEDVLTPLTELFRERMRYDALNYALFREVPLDEEQGGFIDKIDPKKIGMNPAQKVLLKNYLTRLRNNKELDGELLRDFIDGVLKGLEQGVPTFINALTESPTLRKFILSDPGLAQSWHGLTMNKTITEVLAAGTGSCKTLAVISKMLLERANERYKLAIKEIKIIENDAFHVTLEITKKDGSIISYDPTSALYKD